MTSAVCGPSSICTTAVPRTACTTCSDEVQRARVMGVDGERLMAQTELEGRQVEIDVSLVPAVQEGDVLLVHGGVALELESAKGRSGDG